MDMVTRKGRGGSSPNVTEARAVIRPQQTTSSLENMRVLKDFVVL